MADAKYLSHLQALLPRGVAWTRDPDAELTKLLGGLSVELGRVEQRAKDLIEELDPRTTTELIGEWEDVFGVSGGATLADRRAAIHAKALGHGDPSRANFIAMAAALGYAITITEYHNPFTCISNCSDSLYTPKWRFVWDVTTPSGDNDSQLQALFESLAPDHTVVRFFFT